MSGYPLDIYSSRFLTAELNYNQLLNKKQTLENKALQNGQTSV